MIFQIGFTECGAASLAALFQSSGVPSLFGSGSYWRAKGHPALQGRDPQLVIHSNLRAGRPALQGLAAFRAFFGMEFARDGWVIENFRHFGRLAEEYPDARFILNTRDKDDWLQARLLRDGGGYLAHAMERTGMSRRGVLNLWADDYHRHHDMVREAFRDRTGQLIEFDIDRTPVKDLQRFAHVGGWLWARHWRQARAAEAQRAA